MIIARTLAQVESDILASYRERLPAYDYGPGSPERERALVVAEAVRVLEAFGIRVSNDTLPDLATIDGLVRWGEKLLQLPREGESQATGLQAVRVTGVATSNVANGLELIHEPTGSRYEVIEGGVIPSSGQLDVSVVSITVGTIANRDVNDKLVFDSPPVGVDPDADVIAPIDGADDIEAVEKYRARLLRRFVETGVLLRPEDYASFAEAYSFVDTAYVYGNRIALATVDIAATRDGALRALTEAERVALQADFRAAIPNFAFVRVLFLDEQTVDIELTIEELSGASGAWDWGTAAPVEITAYDPNTRQLTLAALPADLAVGGRLTIDDQNGDVLGQISTIRALPGGNIVEIDADYGYSFTASDRIYAQGRLSVGARAAILEYFRNDGDTPGIGPARAGVGRWKDSVTASILGQLVESAEPDIFATTTILPATDEIPNDPPAIGDEYITLLRPGKVLVRRT